jgi:UDP-N-acetyl-D-mannosaminuronate dehydrogenase
MKKFLLGTLLCTLPLASFAQDIKVGEPYSGDIQYRNKKAHITISPDTESSQHFKAVIITDTDTLENRFFSKQENINLNELDKLEKDEKIVKDGRSVIKLPNFRQESSTKMGSESQNPLNISSP